MTELLKKIIGLFKSEAITELVSAEDKKEYDEKIGEMLNDASWRRVELKPSRSGGGVAV